MDKRRPRSPSSASREIGATTALGDLIDIELVIIWNMLEEPRVRNEILRSTDRTAGDGLISFVTLELRGLIRKEFGVWHRI